MAFDVENGIGDRWGWMFGEDSDLKVNELSRLVEEKILQVKSGGQATIWNKGIDLDSVLCPSCNNSVESCAHSLVACDLAMSAWEKWVPSGDLVNRCFILKERNARLFVNIVTSELCMQVRGSLRPFNVGRILTDLECHAEVVTIASGIEANRVHASHDGEADLAILVIYGPSPVVGFRSIRVSRVTSRFYVCFWVNMWDALVADKPNVTNDNFSDSVINMPSEVSSSDPIVQSVYIHEKPSSYVGAKFSIRRKVVEMFFSEDGLSIIASQIGKSIMLDSYTSSMCIESWGRSSFARCLIEINADDVLQESLTMGVPLIEGSGFTIETVSIPPTVVTHNVATPIVENTNDGFQTVGKKNKKGKTKSTNGGQFGGHSVKQTVRYEPKATISTPKKGTTNVGNASKLSSMSKKPLKATVTSTKEGNITMSNSYAALDAESDEDVENVSFIALKIGESSSSCTAADG
ncbi:hypothetical protein Tco_1421158 [Tanacetum coccineum]